MSYVRKTKDIWYLLSNYGDGWNEECWEESWSEIKKRYNEYRQNTSAALNIVRRRKKIAGGEVK